MCFLYKKDVRCLKGLKNVFTLLLLKLSRFTQASLDLWTQLIKTETTADKLLFLVKTYQSRCDEDQISDFVAQEGFPKTKHLSKLKQIKSQTPSNTGKS